MFLREGIAQYFETKFGEEKIPKTKIYISDYNKKSFKLNYQHSYNIIAPILDKHGVKKGIEKIFSSPPPEWPDWNKIPNLKAYQRKLLE
jgi:hypothetical protein